MMNSALQLMLTTRRGIIVFMAQVMMLDATAAYPNHMGHSVCFRNSILSPQTIDRRHRDTPLARGGNTYHSRPQKLYHGFFLLAAAPPERPSLWMIYDLLQLAADFSGRGRAKSPCGPAGELRHNAFVRVGYFSSMIF
jgi:hypothetical protein